MTLPNLLSFFVLAHGDKEMFHFHPPLVHFPIALYFLELLLLVIWAVKHEDDYRRFARFSFWIGYVLMFFTMAAGLIDAGGIKGIRGDEDVREHFIGACVVLLVYTARAFYWKLSDPASKRYRLFLVVGAVIGVSAVAVTAFLGGELVY